MDGSEKPVDLHRSILIINQNNDSRKRHDLMELVDKTLDLSNESPNLKEDAFKFLKLMTSTNAVTSISIIGTDIYASVSGSPRALALPDELVDILTGNVSSKKDLVFI